MLSAADCNGIPIVLHPLRISKGITNNRHELEHELIEFIIKSIFCQYGKIWSYHMNMETLEIRISYDNEESRNLAVQRQNGKYIHGRQNAKYFHKQDIEANAKKLRIEPCSSKLMNGTVIVKQKLNNTNTDINILTKCKNYWNKDLYPLQVVEYAFKNGDSSIDIDEHDFQIRCYHPDIEYPFVIHMASENRITQHVIHIRPQTTTEIARMLWNSVNNVSLLKQVIPHNHKWGIDWRYYKLWGSSLIWSYAHNDTQPYECIKHMINVIKCDVNNANNQLLHIAAMRHDIELVNLLLDFGANPLLKSDDKYKETALVKCKWRWKLYQEQQTVHIEPQNIIRLKSCGESEGKESKDNDDIKQQVSSGRIVYIQSIYLAKMLYISSYGDVIYLQNVETSKKQNAQFVLQSVEENIHIIKLQFGSANYKRICSLKGFSYNINADIVLSANIEDKTVDFLPYAKRKQQHWFVEKERVGNDKWITFSVCIDDKKYQLFATDKHRLTLKQIMNDNDEEGRNLDDALKPLFVILNECTFHTFESNWINYKSALNGDIENCRRIHQQIVERLEKAMTIQKLHGNHIKSEKRQNDENNESIRRFGIVGKPQQHYNRFSRYKSYKHREKGICKRYSVSKGFGFITTNDGSDIFVHYSEIKARGFQSLLEGEHLEFEIVVQSDGRRKAINVTGLYGAYVKGQSNVQQFRRCNK